MRTTQQSVLQAIGIAGLKRLSVAVGFVLIAKNLYPVATNMAPVNNRLLPPHSTVTVILFEGNN